MLDTVALTLRQDAFEVLDVDAFSPSARGLYQQPYYRLGGRGYIHCTQNPTKSDLERGIRKPRLTLTKRACRGGGLDCTLRVESSLPKLVLGNNFSELTDSDFPRVLDTLHRRLSGMGIRVTQENLKNAPVSSIHYSKNVKLNDYDTCTMIIKELGKIDLTQRLDCTKTDYRNEGSALRAHASSYEILFYDKVQDMRQAMANGEQRGMEKDYVVQPDLLACLEQPRPPEVLRMEVRLGNRRKLQMLLQELEIPADMTFGALFSTDISRKVLLHYWNKATTDMPLLALSQFAPEDIYMTMAAESRGGEKPAKLLQRLGMFALVQSIGLRQTKALVTQQANIRTWQRLKQDMNGLDAIARMKYAVMREVEGCLKAGKPLKLMDYAIPKS